MQGWKATAPKGHRVVEHWPLQIPAGNITADPELSSSLDRRRRSGHAPSIWRSDHARRRDDRTRHRRLHRYRLGRSRPLPCWKAVTN